MFLLLVNLKNRVNILSQLDSFYIQTIRKL
nr:MAG TPA: hypothetical protein [Bacteriophage sp.]